MCCDPDRPPAVGRLPRRCTDRVEDAVAWILMAASLLLILIAGVTGLAVQARMAERAELDSGSTSQTRAVLLAEARVVTSEISAYGPMQVPARWTDRDRQEHVGLVLVHRSEPAGAEVDVWIDARGEITSGPVRPENAVIGGILAGVAVLCAGGTLLIATWMGVRRVIGLCHSRRWEQEWARVEPEWRGNVR